MIQNDFQVLPFYKTIDAQNHNKPYAFGNTYPLVCPVNTLPYFIIEFNHVDLAIHREVIKSASLIPVNGGYSTSIKDFLLKNWTYKSNFTETTDLAVFKAGSYATLNLDEGPYYIELEFPTGQILYSEIICFSQFTDNCIKLTWYDNANLPISDNVTLLYSEGYKNMVYIDSMIGKPEYSLDEEGEERDGYFFAEKQISKKTYRFSFVAPEYLCDMLRLAGMSDHIEIYFNGKSYNCDSILTSIDWEDQGDLASVEVEFTADSIVKKIAAAWPNA